MEIIKTIQFRKLVLGFILLLTLSTTVTAQQDPMYTQYMFNTQTINPAYAGTWESVGFMALSRMQWVGIEGFPSTQTFSFQMPLKNKKVGVGLDIVNDRIGFENRFSLNADYSYKITFDRIGNLRMGLKAGFSIYNHNLTEHSLYDDMADPAFAGDIENKLRPNVGIGFLLENPTYYAGISMPKLLGSKMSLDDNNFAVQGELRHFFLIAGYVYPINRDIKLKPTMLAKVVVGEPLQVDFTASVLLKDKISLGAMYRIGDSFGFMAQWVFERKLRVGYAIDFSTSNLRNYHNSSHEIMVSYELRFLEKDVVSPRFF
jgi:type IX secretion system PorP/SprF family membrane protein